MRKLTFDNVISVGNTLTEQECMSNRFETSEYTRIVIKHNQSFVSSVDELGELSKKIQLLLSIFKTSRCFLTSFDKYSVQYFLGSLLDVVPKS